MASGSRRAPAAVVAGALGVLVAVFAFVLRREAVDWDGLALLHRPDGHLLDDPAHLLYPSLLRGWIRALALLGLEPVAAGSLLSAVGLGLLVAFLVAILRELGAGTATSVLAAVAFAAGESVYRTAATIEVYQPALATLAASILVAIRSRTFLGACASLLLLALAAGLHAGCAFGVFGVAYLLLTRPTPSRRGAVFALALGVLLGAAALGTVLAPSLRELIAALRGLLPRSTAVEPESGFAPSGRIFLYLAENAPGAALLLLSAAAALFFPRGPGRAGRALLPGAFLACPFLSAYAVLGVPTLGLLLPATLGIVIAAAPALPKRGASALALGAALVQVLVSAPMVAREHARPDPLLAEARALVEAAPNGAVFLAGPVAWHLRHLGWQDVVAIDEIFPAARASGQAVDPREVLTTSLSPFAHRVILLGSDCAPRLVQQAAAEIGDEERAIAMLSALLLLGRDPATAPAIEAGRWRLLPLSLAPDGR